MRETRFQSCCCCCHFRLCETPWPPCPSPSPKAHPNSCQLHQWCHPSYLILWCPLLLLPSIFPNIRDFSNVSAVCIRWPKYWSFSFSISLSKEYSEFISLKIDWFALLAVQGTPRSLLQHHSSKPSILGSKVEFLILWYPEQKIS